MWQLSWRGYVCHHTPCSTPQSQYHIYTICLLHLFSFDNSITTTGWRHSTHITCNTPTLPSSLSFSLSSSLSFLSSSLCYYLSSCRCTTPYHYSLKQESMPLRPSTSSPILIGSRALMYVRGGIEGKGGRRRWRRRRC